MATAPSLMASVSLDALAPPAVEVPAPSPVRSISSDDLRSLGQHLSKLFTQYESDRRIAELKWLRNLRQFLGIYDPEAEKELAPNRSRAYPRLTRVKCISVLSRIMNLMFPGNERNYEVKASPSPDMSDNDVVAAIQAYAAQVQADGGQFELTEETVETALQRYADDKAEELCELIDDQLQELGGDQTLDYVALNRKAALSGIMYGLGLLEGPYVRQIEKNAWTLDPNSQQPVPIKKITYKPQYDFLSVWDFYPDMSAKTLLGMDGYFIRRVMSRAQVRRLADRPDFFASQIKTYLSRTQQGNYKAKTFESELRVMGVKINVNEQKAETAKYEVLIWRGSVSGSYLRMAGVEVAEDMLSDDLDAEIWMIDGNVIKASLNPWVELGANIRTLHAFQFEEDDTSVVGNGLPNIMRDSQMSVAAATRMLLDNASVTCGPNIEINTDLMRPDQDLKTIAAYKIWYREGMGPDAQFPAVRNVQIDAHLGDLLKIIETFMGFADMETFVGPATGGDMAQAPSEPMRTAAGASMLRGDAALPFKDIIRNFDSFTQSLVASMVGFNHKYNPAQAMAGDYNVIARGATSLMAKEVRGMQIDQLAMSIRPEEMLHVDERKLVEARFNVRDLGDMLVPPDVAQRRKEAQEQAAAAQQAQAQQQMEAQVRETLSQAFKNITQGQKNSAAADAAAVTSALSVMEQGMNKDEQSQG